MSSPAPVGKRAIGKHLIVLVIYGLLSLVLTWPLTMRFSTHVPGDGIDDPALVWNLWWIQERLINQLSLDLFDVDWMFFPIRINLAFYTLTPLNGLLSVPLQSASGLVVANNALFLSTLVLGAYGTFLLTRWLLSRRTLILRIDQPALSQAGRSRRPMPFLATDDWIALVCGLIYGFASSKLFYASLGQFNIASSQWIPFFVLFLLRIVSSRTPANGFRAAAMAGLFLIFQTWAELTYATFLVIFAGITFAYALIGLVLGHRGTGESVSMQTDLPAEKRPYRQFLILISQFALVGILFVIGVAPFLRAMTPDLLREGDFFTSGGGFADIFSADLLGYLMPTRLHPWLGEAVVGFPFPNDKGQQIYIGYAAMLMAALGVGGLVSSASRRLRWEGWFWLFTTFLFWWLTLGPTVRWNGQSLGIPGPFVLVSRLPFFSGNRYPSRYSVMLMLFVAILAAYGLAWLVERLQGRKTSRSASQRRWMAPGVVLMLALLFLIEHLSTPLPLNDFRVPPIYEHLSGLSDDATLLELPTGWRNGARVLGRSDVLIMMQQWYQSEHGQRRLGGNTSRNPGYKFQYFTDAPLMGDLIALMNADRDHIAREVERDWAAIVARNQSVASYVLDFLDVDHLMVYVDHAPEPLLRFVDEVLPVSLVEEWQGLDWQGRPSTIRLYAVDAGNGPMGQINLSGVTGNLHLAEGWSSFPVDTIRYAVRPEAELMLDLPEDGGEVSLRLFGPAPTVDLLVNETLVDVMPILADDWYTFTLPAGVAAQSVDRLTFRFDGEGVPAAHIAKSASSKGWPIGNTGHFLSGDAAVVVHSAGEEVGDFAHIFLSGRNVSQNQRGYNLAAIDQDGTLLDSVAFDTFFSKEEADGMAEWIQQWPVGTIIASAVRDEASMNLTGSAIEELRKIGVAADLRSQFRSSHAFVGVVGASPGTALEETSLLSPSAVYIGSPVDAETVFGGISAVRLPHLAER